MPTPSPGRCTRSAGWWVALGVQSRRQRFASLQGAVDAACRHPGLLRHRSVSPVYETQPVDAPTPDSPSNSSNAILLADTTLPAARLMERALAVEDAFDREAQRGAQRPAHARRRPPSWWATAAPTTNFLRLPHPRAHERAFVLSPGTTSSPTRCSPTPCPIADLLAAGSTEKFRHHQARRSGARGPVTARPASPAGGPPPSPHHGAPRWPSRAVIGLVVGWLLRPVAVRSDRHGAVRHPWGAGPRGWSSSPPSWRTVAWHHLADDPGPPAADSRTTAPSTASCSPGPCALVGALGGAGHAGYAISWLGDASELAPTQRRLLRSGVAAVRGACS